MKHSLQVQDDGDRKAGKMKSEEHEDTDEPNFDMEQEYGNPDDNDEYAG